MGDEHPDARPDRRGATVAGLLRDRARGGIELTVRGASMGRRFPAGATVHVVAASRPRRGEVWAFATASGQLVLHRCRSGSGPPWVFRGDGREALDPPVEDDHLIGRAVVIVAGGRQRRLGVLDRAVAGLARFTRPVRTPQHRRRTGNGA
jgi:hypothetical protein